jgi:hypothetical protein
MKRGSNISNSSGVGQEDRCRYVVAFADLVLLVYSYAHRMRLDTKASISPRIRLISERSQYVTREYAVHNRIKFFYL